MRSGVLVFMLVVAACHADGTAPDLPSLDLLPAPGTNTAVVMLAADVADGPGVVAGGQLLFYDLVAGSIPHALTYDQRDAAPGHFLVVISELYLSGTVVTNGSNNRLAWTSPGGTEYRPSAPCEMNVVQAFVLGQDSEMIVHAVCRVSAPNGRSVTLLAKANRFQPGFGP